MGEGGALGQLLGWAAAAERARAAARGAARRRVLVVDDSRDAAEMLAEALLAAGYDARVAYDGPEALGVAAGFRPEIALVDISLPVMDGYDLARRLREVPGLAEVKLVAMTGYCQAAGRRRSRLAGFHGYLVKPVDLEQVEALLCSLLGAAPPAGAVDLPAS